VIGYEPVRRLLEQRPALMWSLGKLLTTRLRAVGDALADTVFLDLTARTAKRILEMAGEADQFQLPVTQEELAAMVGASRERVNKAIAGFVRVGWLNQRGRHYTIVDREQLALRAQGAPQA
jgi:CRP-like cAMP-binding protein